MTLCKLALYHHVPFGLNEMQAVRVVYCIDITTRLGLKCLYYHLVQPTHPQHGSLAVPHGKIDVEVWWLGVTWFTSVKMRSAHT